MTGLTTRNVPFALRGAQCFDPIRFTNGRDVPWRRRRALAKGLSFFVSIREERRAITQRIIKGL